MQRHHRTPHIIEVDLEAQLSQLESVYRFRNTNLVRAFLKDKPELLPYLWSNKPYIAKHFGDHTLALLDVVVDPEVDGWEQLFIIIPTSLTLQLGFDELDKMIEEWQETLPEEQKEYDDPIVFDLEFV